MSNDTTYSINQYVRTTGSLGVGFVKDESKVRIVVTEAGASNFIRVRARLTEQDNWITLKDIVGNANTTIDVFTYEQIEVSCLVYDSVSDVVRIVASSFDGAVISIITPDGELEGINSLTFTSSDNSVLISADSETGEIDFKAIGGGGGSKYSEDFDATTDWGSPSLGYYSLVIPFSTHSIINPDIEVFELVSGTYEQIYIDTFVDSSTDITIQVTETPDLRFAGKIIIS